MDLNTLLFDHQVALIRAGKTGTASARDRSAIHDLSDRIRALRERLGVCQYTLEPAGIRA